MFYIHQTSCIFPQHPNLYHDISKLNEPVEKKMLAIEPANNGIPLSILRRMGKAVRMGVNAAMPLLKNASPQGIILGTANSGKEDCVKFLHQLIDYNEGLLTPLSFVQSTPNAAAAQIGLLTKNHGYNITHTHLGLSFELAMIDVDMLLKENPLNSYLLGAVDDISSYNYIFENKMGCFKEATISNKQLYTTNSMGSIAGEGAAMFLVNGNQDGSILTLLAIDTLHHEEVRIVKEKLQDFIETNLPRGENIDLLLTGENGDNDLIKFYAACETLMREEVTVARFKHLSGEFPTAIATGLWLCGDLLQKQTIPQHMIKKETGKTVYKNVLIYNNYNGLQHSFMLVSLSH